MFHILFPVLTVGLAVYLAVVEFLWLTKKEEIYYRICRFWAKIFAINFGVGIVSLSRPFPLSRGRTKLTG